MGAALKVPQAIVATATVVVLLAACGAPAQKADTTTPSADKRGQWIELPFSVGLAATGIAITKDGDVYVGDIGRVYELDRSGFQMKERVPVEDLVRETGRVLLLEKGAAQQKVALDGVDTMGGIAVGADGAIYVVTSKPEVLQFPKGATTPTALPLKLDIFVGVDDAGRVYVTDGSEALRLDRGAAEPTELDVRPSSAGCASLAVTNAGDVYCVGAAWGNAPLWILDGAGPARGVVLTDLAEPLAMAVHAGDVYVLDDAGKGVPQEDYATENLRIVKFSKAVVDSAVVSDDPFADLPKATSSAVIPFTPTKKGAYHTMEVAPDGDIYLTDGAKVLKLTPA